MKRHLPLPLLAGLLLTLNAPAAQVCNLKVITDASPDYSDMASLIHSVTAKWPTPQEKCWALFYWNHMARRQTTPMQLHGLALTDPIRQFNDYGYTMCSTISGINCGIWHHLGLPVKYWDISLHTVSEVFYDGRWHMYDNSMSALYTLCDGKTIAGVEDIGREGACEASGGRSERGHVAKYHCLYSTGPDGFLTGADTQRSLDEEAHCFNPNGLKYRYYYFDWDYGHRYILNLRDNESYARYYRSLGKTPEFYVPNGGKDPDSRYRIRGNGEWVFRPSLAAGDYRKQSQSAVNIGPGANGLQPVEAGRPAEIVFKVESANVLTSQAIKAALSRHSAEDQAGIALSTDNGLSWKEVWGASSTGNVVADLKLIDEVNGAYEVLVKVSLKSKTASHVVLRELEIRSRTMLNAKTQPKLNLGRNTVYVGSGEQTESVVIWPELQGNSYKAQAVEEKNIASTKKHPGYQGTIYPAVAGQDAYLVYRLDAPGDITRIHFGGRFYNRAPRSRHDLLYSLDEGKTWTNSWSLRRTTPPWDVIHYESVEIPQGHRSVRVKYLMNTSEPAPSGCGIYAVRLEANYEPADTEFRPVQITFAWSERQADRSLVERSHTQTISKLPFKYNINVGGEDLPVVQSLRMNLQGAVAGVKDGYSDGRDVGGSKFLPDWLTCGKNLAIGKPYTLSIQSSTNWGAGDPDGKKLTSGAGGPSYAGGTSYRSGALWPANANPVITLDLQTNSQCASFGMNLHGYPWWDALKGEVKDRVEVFTSNDGAAYQSQGFLKVNLWWKEIPANYMWTDEETMTSGTFRLMPKKPVLARYVRYQVTNKRFFDCAGLEVLDSIQRAPFDLRIALPDEAGPVKSFLPEDDGSANSGMSNTLPGNRAKEKEPKEAKGRPAVSVLVGATEGNGQAIAAAGPGAEPAGEPVLEPATLHSLGVYWIIRGDANQNAKIGLECREIGSAGWNKCMPLFRVEKGANRLPRGESQVKVEADAWLFAGSVVLLEPGTEYELRLSLSDPDGSKAERILRARTAIEPQAPAGLAQFHVAPGNGGGSGTLRDPFRGLGEAQSHAKPGSLFLIQAGVYPGTFAVSRNGEPGKPIIWRGVEDGEVVLDGQATEGRVLDAGSAHDVWFERLTVRNGQWGLVAHNAKRIVVRRCRFTEVKNGITATRNDAGELSGFFISDNALEGPLDWPGKVRGASVEEFRGIQISGSGHDICYNRIRNFKDGIDTFPSPVCAAIDIHHNEISECLDDGCEMDESERNTRLFCNRFTDVFQGISVQPVRGGPVYIFRNAVYNIEVEPIKMHNSPSGALFFHNTFVKKGEPFLLLTPAPVHNCVTRNNLFVGSGGNYGFECDPPMVNCDFDFDGFGGGPWGFFMKWNKARYKTLAEAREKAPVNRNAAFVDAGTAFASGIQVPPAVERKFDFASIDLRLSATSGAVDRGEVLPGFNDGYVGRAPDLGAYEAAQALPHYGPRTKLEER